jgi:acetyl esterase/lipase
MFQKLSILCLTIAATFVSAGEIKLERDVTFETIDKKPVKLDVAYPADQGPGPFPMILCIHGGAWRAGDKSKFTPMIESMARHGFVAASVNYRFTPKYNWPSQLDDSKAALRFLKSHAAEYHIDVDRVGATGESAGAQLALLLGFMPDEPGATPLTSTRVRAVVNYYGATDISSWHVAPFIDFLWQRHFHESIETGMAKFLGTNDRTSPQVKAASPITYVDDTSPPVLTFHGTLDPMVPFNQAEVLHKMLRKHDVVEKLVPIANGLHGGWPQDVKASADQEALEFFDSYLKPGPVAQVQTAHTLTAASKAEPTPAVR